MSELVIQSQGLGKLYHIAALRKGTTFREAVMAAAKAPFRRARGLLAGSWKKEEPVIWALKDVSFDVRAGEVVGVIGRNGAGKSTLLKILTRITEPTEGRAEIRGRVASLLEVGTGFHPDLSGRENVFLNGAILGMSRREIRRQFDEIVAFAEVERFIETPVKYYSSGMYVRLAFAVAAHLDPDILLVDEVLAVGDTAFQQKCLGRMRDVAGGGRTVLFVSHNMAAVSNLCTRCLWLDGGLLRMCGPAQEVISSYLSESLQSGAEREWADDGPGDARVRLRGARILSPANKPAAVLDWREPFALEIDYEVRQPVRGLQVGFWLHAADGSVVFVSGDREDAAWRGILREPGRYRSRCDFAGAWLNSGHYTVTVASDLDNVESPFVERHAIGFHIQQTGLPVHSTSRPDGVICPSLPWRITRE